jgi:acyl-lipid omega-6 desaturase (Delta-12 desaturase)
MDASLKQTVARLQKPVLRKSLWQILNTVVPYVATFAVMFWTLNISYWLTLALSVVAAGFMIRTFIIFHDCAHGSFFRSPAANRLVGIITGILTFTPYQHWRHQHALHHATSGDLDGRGAGDIWTLTVREYLEAPFWKRLAYRLFRNPFILFVIVPIYVFLVYHRFPAREAGTRERRSVYWTNGAVLAIAVALSLTAGIKAYLLVQLPVIAITGSVGLWLFYIQHQFDGVYWERRTNWDFTEASLLGSSFYKLPRTLQWWTGSIGFHHIHHLSPAIPNYHLERCHRENRIFQEVKPVTLWSGLKAIPLRLWDEQRKKLVGFRRLKTLGR